MIKQLSLCITNYNRTDKVIRAFEQVVNDDRISEIIIVDDCSHISHFQELVRLTDPFGPKVKIYRNSENLGMSLNKVESIKKASNDWCILFDSDNIIDSSYLDALFHILTSEENKPNDDIIFCPDFAKPQFNYECYSGKLFSFFSIKPFLHESEMGCLLNTCNYVVNKKSYLDVFDFNPEIMGTDTLWFNYLWLKSGRGFYVVRGMQYQHEVHDGSEWLKHASYNLKKGEEIIELIENL
jgi:glycosyltransferase involved in cell wall biosynthesis